MSAAYTGDMRLASFVLLGFTVAACSSASPSGTAEQGQVSADPAPSREPHAALATPLPGDEPSGMLCGATRCAKPGQACCVESFVVRTLATGEDENDGDQIDGSGVGTEASKTYAFACVQAASDCSVASQAVLACAFASDCGAGDRCCASRGADGRTTSSCKASCGTGELELCDPRAEKPSCASGLCSGHDALTIGLPARYGTCAH